MNSKSKVIYKGANLFILEGNIYVYKTNNASLREWIKKNEDLFVTVILVNNEVLWCINREENGTMVNIIFDSPENVKVLKKLSTLSTITEK